MKLLWSLGGLAIGAVIGVGFGLVQEAAGRRLQKLENAGQFGNGWSVMPGSMRRVAYLLCALVLVQIICPLLFTDGTQWWVSGGLVAGYGYRLYLQLRRRMSQPN